MLQKLVRRLQVEKSHFDDLGEVVKHLLYSYILYLISYPIIGLFINAYFWRQTQDITLIAAYNLGFFIALPIGFYLNGLLLRKVHILKLYWIGAVLQGVAAFLAIFIPSLSFDRVLIYGLIYGLGGGLYWGNKNYITLKITKGRNRLYYNNLESSLDLLINIVMPVVIGWFIVFGEHTSTYTADFAYKILMIVAIVLLAIGGYILQSANIYSEKINHITIAKPSKYWNVNRLVQILYWILGGVNFFIPSMLILMFIGKEGILGTVESIVAAISAMILYVVGRKTKPKHGVWVVGIASAIFLVGAVIFNLTYGLVGAAVYTIACSMTSAVTWNAVYTNSQEVIDKEQEKNLSLNQYAFVFDNELFFNIGRVLSMILFFGIAKYASQETALRLVPLIAGALQLCIIFPMNYLVKYVNGDVSPTTEVQLVPKLN